MKRRIGIFLLFVVLLGCESANLTYLLACPAENVSTTYHNVTVEYGFIKRVGSLDLLYHEGPNPVMAVSGCRWEIVGDEYWEMSPLMVQTHGDWLWWDDKPAWAYP